MKEVSIFHDFDIRGRYPSEINEVLARKIGQAFFFLENPKRVVVGRDERKTSQSLKNSIFKGLSALGVEVIDIDEVSTPQFYFAVKRFGTDGGLMVTASHLPRGYAGIKFVLTGAMPLKMPRLLKIKEMVSREPTLGVIGDRHSKVVRQEIERDYLLAIKRLFPQSFFEKKVKGLFAASNPAIVRTMKNLKNIKVLKLKEGQEVNPLLAKERKTLALAVKEENAPFGVQFDVDGDRAIFIDSFGRLIHPSWALGLIGAFLIRRERRKSSEKPTVALDMRAGLSAKDLIREAGGKVRRLPAWHTETIWAMVKDQGIIFGGETSGHMIWREWFPIDDGLVAALLFAWMLKKEVNFKNKLEFLRKTYFPLAEKNYLFKSPTRRRKVLREAENFFRRKGYPVNTVDGVTVERGNFRLNLRESKTEPVLRLNLETKDRLVLGRIYKEIDKLIRAC